MKKDDSTFLGFDEWTNMELISELPMEKYLSKLQKGIDKLEEVMERNFPNRFFVLKTCLSVKLQLRIADITQPFALFLLGNPASKKTTILEIINATPGCYKSDKFTPKSFVSHAANVKREDLVKVDLLPKLQFKTFITPELAPMFAADRDQLMEVFGILTRILDGRGLLTESGVHGQRGYDGDYYFMWLGAIVDIPHSVWKIMGNLGPKWYYYRIQDDVMSIKEKKSSLKKGFSDTPYMDKIHECQKAINIVYGLINCHPCFNDNAKMEWDTNKDDSETLDKIIVISMLLARLRGSVPTWFTGGSDSSGTNYHYEMPTIEDPERASKALYNLARGHALLFGRNYIQPEDLEVVVAVALSSAQKERIALLSQLIEQNGEISTDIFMTASGVSKNTALKNMKLLNILGIVNYSSEDKYKIILKKEFEWFLSDEFKIHWHNYLNPKSAKKSIYDQKKLGRIPEYFEKGNGKATE